MRLIAQHVEDNAGSVEATSPELLMPPIAGAPDRSFVHPITGRGRFGARRVGSANFGW